MTFRSWFIQLLCSWVWRKRGDPLHDDLCAKATYFRCKVEQLLCTGHQLIEFKAPAQNFD